MQGVKAYEGSGGIPPPILTCTLTVHYRLHPPCSWGNSTRYPSDMKVAGRSLDRTLTGLLRFIIHNLSLRTATSGSTKSFPKCIMKDYVKYLSSAEKWWGFFCVTLKVLRAYIHPSINTYIHIYIYMYMYIMCSVHRGSPSAGSGLPARADRLKIFTLSQQDWLSAAEWLGFGVWKG